MDVSFLDRTTRRNGGDHQIFDLLITADLRGLSAEICVPLWMMPTLGKNGTLKQPDGNLKTEMNHREHRAHGVKPVEEMGFAKPHKAKGLLTQKRIPHQAVNIL